MSNPLIHIFIGLAENIADNEPEIAALVQQVLAKPDPTAADWIAVHQAALVQAYGEIAALAPGLPKAVSPPLAIADAQSNAPIGQPGASAVAVSTLPGSKSGLAGLNVTSDQASMTPAQSPNRGYSPDVG